MPGDYCGPIVSIDGCPGGVLAEGYNGQQHIERIKEGIKGRVFDFHFAMIAGGPIGCACVGQIFV